MMDVEKSRVEASEKSPPKPIYLYTVLLVVGLGLLIVAAVMALAASDEMRPLAIVLASGGALALLLSAILYAPLQMIPPAEDD